VTVEEVGCKFATHNVLFRTNHGYVGLSIADIKVGQDDTFPGVKGFDAALLMYDVTNVIGTFKRIPEWYQTLKEVLPIIVVGNKADDETNREKTLPELTFFTHSKESVPNMEISVAMSKNLAFPFLVMLRFLMKDAKLEFVNEKDHPRNSRVLIESNVEVGLSRSTSSNSSSKIVDRGRVHLSVLKIKEGASLLFLGKCLVERYYYQQFRFTHATVFRFLAHDAYHCRCYLHTCLDCLDPPTITLDKEKVSVKFKDFAAHREVNATCLIDHQL
jgi:hypothetical protein